MLLITLRPGLGITRLRFNGYNLSLIVRHPFEISTAKVIKRFGKSGAVCVGDFKNGHCFGTDTIWYKKSIYVGVCVKGKPNGDGILYIHKASGRKYYFMEGLFVDGKFASGLYSNSYGVFSTTGGTFTADYRKGNSDIEIYSQLELRYRYEFLKTLKPKKFPGATLTEEQRLFLDGKLSSEQILSIRKSQ